MATKRRKPSEVLKIINCKHELWLTHKIDREYGYKNCCVCENCTVSCGEYLNTNYGKWKSDKERVDAVFGNNNKIKCEG